MVKEDLITSLDKYSMSLKYCISSKQVDPQVPEHPERGPETVEKTMGLLWDMVEDTITAVPRYNLFGESRGKQQGPNLKDMTLEQIPRIMISTTQYMGVSLVLGNEVLLL